VESATTELTRLPGLEVAETKPELKPEHWIERGPSKRLMLFSGRSHPGLAQKIAEKLGIQVGDVSLRTFASGETYCRYEESIRGSDLFIVQTSYLPQHVSGSILSALEASVHFAIPGQRALEHRLDVCTLDGGRVTASALSWLLACVFLGSALSRVRLAASIVRLESSALVLPADN